MAAQLAKGAEINGVTYSGETFAGVTELRGTDIIEIEPQPEPEPEPEIEPQPEPITPISTTPDTSNVKVWSFNHVIYIANAPDTEFKIIDFSGRVLKISKTKSSFDEIRINQSGMLLIIINGKSFKIIN